jgi:hypothetical protein
MKKIACPKCGNTEDFYLTLRHLRLAITYDSDRGYVAHWDEGESDIAYCAYCHTELKPEDVDYLYSYSAIE